MTETRSPARDSGIPLPDPGIPGSDHRLRAWSVWAIGAACFAYAFFQRVAPSVMVEDLMRTFAVGGAVLGNLSAAYFYPYAALQIPIGMMLDRLGPRRMLAAAALASALGSAVFATAGTFGLAYTGRLLVGIGAAVGFIGALRLAANWFPPGRFAFVSGLTMLVGMSGGIGGQAPLAAAVGAIGWRATMVWAAGVALALGILTWLVVRDHPPRATDTAGNSDRSPPPALRETLRRVVRLPRMWLLALYAGGMAGPLLSYAALWGVPHLMQAYDLQRPAAAGSMSLMLVGWACGAPLGGWISDHLGRRRTPMGVAALLASVCWLVILYVPGISLPLMWILLVAVGASSGAMVVCYAVARELVPASLGGTATGLVNMATVGAGALLQPLIGALLDMSWDGTLVEGARVYAEASYRIALTTMPACALLASAVVLAVPETLGRSWESRERGPGS